MKIYQYESQRVVNRVGGVIQSITPTYNEDLNKYNTFFNVKSYLDKMSKEFPQEKMVVEIQNVPDDQYESLKDEIGIGEHFQDHSNKFFYNVGVNAVIVVYKVY